ncbi:MAG: acyltransferase [Actinomycetota bacterium]|nr:acyltransferase [Actinomycetota bacterium]
MSSANLPITERRAPVRDPVRALWIPAFDGIRGSISVVIALTHISLATGWRPNHEPFRALRGSMFFSIEFLFLMGGFAMFLPAVAYGGFVGVRTYALRRAGRLLPLYWLTLALAVGVGPLLRPVSGAYFPHDVPAVLSHVVFLQQELYPRQAGFGVQGIVWTMSITAVFCVIFPLVLRPYLRWPFLGLAAAVGVTVAWRETTGNHPDLFAQFPLFGADFALGMTTAWIYVQLRRSAGARLRRALAWACPAAALALLFLLYAAGLPVVDDHQPLWGESLVLSIAVPLAFAAVLLTVAYLPAWAQRPLANRLSRWIGSINYGIFLFHFLVIWLVLGVADIPRNGSPRSMMLLTVLVLPLTVAAAWAGTRFVERPIRTWAQRAGRRHVPVPHVPAPPGRRELAGVPAQAAPAPSTAP